MGGAHEFAHELSKVLGAELFHNVRTMEFYGPRADT